MQLTSSHFSDLTPDQYKIWSDLNDFPIVESKYYEDLEGSIQIYQVPGVGRVVVGVCDYKGPSDPQLIGPEVICDQVAQYDRESMGPL